jgi:hypothetical protein
MTKEKLLLKKIKLGPQFDKSKKRQKAFRRGAKCFYEGRPQERNPYLKENLKALFNLFNLGYLMAMQDEHSKRSKLSNFFVHGNKWVLGG